MAEQQRVNDIDKISRLSTERAETERQQYATKPWLNPSKELGDGASPSTRPSFSSKEILDALARNEDGDAALFIRLQQGRLVYDHAAAEWYTWAGHHWKLDKTEQALAGVSDIADIYVSEMGRQAWVRAGAEKAGQTKAADMAKNFETSLARRVRDLRTIRRKRAVLHLARAGSNTLGITGEEWDRNPWLLGVTNGVINLKTGQFRPGTPEDFIKTAAPTKWEGLDAPAPTWERLLSDIFGNTQDLISFMQRLLGYGITGRSDHHIFIILHGEGRNGKGTLLETIRTVLGEYAMKTESELLLQQKLARNASAPNSAILSLQGRRIVWASETSDGERLSAGRLKELVGGDTLSGRPVFGKHHIQFTPSHLLLLITNSKPKAPAGDYALWQRVHLVPFQYAFVDNPTASNERKADIYLGDKLKAEASGVLSWLVRGCLIWQREGLNPPDIVRAATEDYRKDEDILGHFIDERCVLGDSFTVRAQIFYEEYRTWASENGLGEFSGVRFGKDMKERFHPDSDNKGNFYIGVGVKG